MTKLRELVESVKKILEEPKIGSRYILPKGTGFWDTTDYPPMVGPHGPILPLGHSPGRALIGGKFERVKDRKGLTVTVKRTFKSSSSSKGTDAEGEAEDGRTVAFDSRDIAPDFDIVRSRLRNRLGMR